MYNIRYSFRRDVFGLHNWKNYKKNGSFYNKKWKTGFEDFAENINADDKFKRERRVRFCKRCGCNQIHSFGWRNLDLTEDEEKNIFQIKRDKKLKKILKGKLLW